MLVYALRTTHKAKTNAHLQCKAISNSYSLCDQFSEYCETRSLTKQVTPFFLQETVYQVACMNSDLHLTSVKELSVNNKKSQ